MREPVMACPACGQICCTKPTNGRKLCELAWHIGCAHSPQNSPTGRVFGCFCGEDHLENIQDHIAERGGYEAHYMDFLMGVSKENQLTQGD